MLLRFAAENIMSFDDTVEFNTFPSSKSHNLGWHKVQCGHVTALRMSVIYGPNGAGKSNLLACLNLLKQMVSTERLGSIPLTDDLFFKFNKEKEGKPSELAIEFISNGGLYYYHIVFSRSEVFEEELYLCEKKQDIPLFIRKGKTINLSPSEIPSEEDKPLTDLLSKMIKSDMPVLSFLGNYYSQEFPVIAEAYHWIANMQVVLPEMRMGYVSHYMDSDEDFRNYVNEIIPTFQSGIFKLKVRKEVINKDDANGDIGFSRAIEDAKSHPGQPIMFQKNIDSYVSNIVLEGNTLYLKTLVAIHQTSEGKEIEMPLSLESDGTRRLIEYLPLLYWILKEGKIFIVDEIERSIHPILIKTIIRKISESKEAKGQIIFTTHESCLLDQDIFRPDEIWFAQKDVNQSTQLYPLSDFNIHRTANIENGYLNGRYGAIPFLSNLEDLKW